MCNYCWNIYRFSSWRVQSRGRDKIFSPHLDTPYKGLTQNISSTFSFLQLWCSCLTEKFSTLILKHTISAGAQNNIINHWLTLKQFRSVSPEIYIKMKRHDACFFRNDSLCIKEWNVAFEWISHLLWYSGGPELKHVSRDTLTVIFLSVPY